MQILIKKIRESEMMLTRMSIHLKKKEKQEEEEEGRDREGVEGEKKSWLLS